MNLVVVESPAKCGKIRDFLGKDFRVMACMGHFRDLPPKGLGIRLPDMKADYVILKEEVAKRLAAEAAKAGTVYLSTDPDREGEAIAWHITQVLPPGTSFRRATFHEITEKAVKKAVSGCGELNMRLVHAQQARRILDRLVGYKLSPELWKAFPGAKALSAGRVQSVAVRLVVEREREIRGFKEETYYRIFSSHEEKGVAFKAELVKEKGGEGRRLAKVKTAADADELMRRLSASAPFRVAEVKRQEQMRRPQPPFTTPDMQAKAANVLRLPAERSMATAQRLYEAGHISYHRTDSVAISEEALTAVRAHIGKRFPPEYLPETPNRFSSKKSAQEAHECIRPTHVETEAPSGLSGDELRLYQLIRNQFVSCQMSAGRDALTVIRMDAGNLGLEARGRVELFDGFRVLNRTEVEEKSDKKEEAEENEKQELPLLVPGCPVGLKGLEKKECSTKPPPRYSEASLIKKLEREGIGRPSTYAAILATIRKRGYVDLGNRKYRAMELGETVNDYLVGRFPDVLDVGFTKLTEDRLDAIAGGTIDMEDFLRTFWDGLRAQLSKGGRPPAKTSSEANGAAGPGCPDCGKTTVLQESPKWKGRFFFCCHGCRCYLETGRDGKPVPDAGWLIQGSGKNRPGRVLTRKQGL